MIKVTSLLLIMVVSIIISAGLNHPLKCFWSSCSGLSAWWNSVAHFHLWF